MHLFLLQNVYMLYGKSVYENEICAFHYYWANKTLLYSLFAIVIITYKYVDKF